MTTDRMLPWIVGLLTLALAGCGAIRSWDTMELRSAQKQAAQKLLSDCQAGNYDACVAVAGHSQELGR